MKKNPHHSRPGFTMVELMIVVIVIGILAAILLPVLSGALRRARIATVVMEMSQIESAMEVYKNANGNEFPPDLSNGNLVEQHLKRAFPRKTVVVSATGMSPNWVTTTGGLMRGSSYLANLGPSEALPFWLGSLFNNPSDPLTGGGSFKSYFSFEEGRLRDVDGDGWYEYYPKYGGESPYVYFHSSTYSTATFSFRNVDRRVPTAFQATVADMAYPYAELIMPANTMVTPNTPPYYVWRNPTKFQIISGGMDGYYGPNANDSTTPLTPDSLDPPGTMHKIFPSTAYPNGKRVEDFAERDNLTSFSEGKTLEDSRP